MASGADAGETVNYSYDPLGRLTGVDHAGTVNNGVQATYGYDPAGNRSKVSVSLGGTPPAPTPTPTPPPPPPGNTPPTATADSAYFSIWQGGTVEVLANDTDPNGDYPLTLQSVTGSNYARVNGSAIAWTGTGRDGVYVLTYTFADSRGATATGTHTVTVGMN